MMLVSDFVEQFRLLQRRGNDWKLRSNRLAINNCIYGFDQILFSVLKMIINFENVNLKMSILDLFDSF